MLYIHGNNIKSKINENYNGKSSELKKFYEEHYRTMREAVSSLHFDEEHRRDFDEAATLFNSYYDQISQFSSDNGITSQSKFASTFLEEISSYLFQNLEQIQKEIFGVYNKGIYAGLKINNTGNIEIIKKDVDFCIGKKVNICIDDNQTIQLIVPVIAVEVKTYLDATMFGEIKSSSKSIRSATPNSRSYVLMGYKCLSDNHIIAARQDSTLTEMFCLRKDRNSPISPAVLYDYWYEIKNAVSSVYREDTINSPGRLLNPEKTIILK